ncbi:t-SNARE VTI1 [Rhodosporidiobolus nylandii]
MDASVFTEYETDLESVLTGVADKLGGEAVTLRGGSSTRPLLLYSLEADLLVSGPQDERRAVFRRVERELEEADEIIAQMEVEVQMADQDKAELQGKLRQHKAVVGKHKAELKSLASNADRDDLFSSRAAQGDHIAIPVSSDLDRPDSPASSSAAQAQRSRLLSGTDKLADGQRRLEESHRMALETEDVGTSILGNLRMQRDTLEHARDTLYDADNSIDRASSTIKKMIRTASTQRLVTYAIIAILVSLILYVLFSKLVG